MGGARGDPWLTHLHECSTRSELLDGGRHLEELEALERLGEVIGVLRLAAVVQLVENRRTHLCGGGGTGLSTEQSAGSCPNVAAEGLRVVSSRTALTTLDLSWLAALGSSSRGRGRDRGLRTSSTMMGRSSLPLKPLFSSQSSSWRTMYMSIEIFETMPGLWVDRSPQRWQSVALTYSFGFSSLTPSRTQHAQAAPSNSWVHSPLHLHGHLAAVHKLALVHLHVGIAGVV
jgi:hypothetical protein